jgi:hypothetical protein
VHPTLRDHPVARLRRGLPRTRAACATGTLRIGFLGGSITDQKTGQRWPEPFLGSLGTGHPTLRLVIENAAIGATGTDLAVFRARRDILDRGCDLVFVEYAVNDSGTPALPRARAREGLLRQLLASGADVVLVHTHMQDFHADLREGRLPASIADFELLAEHYNVPTVLAGLHAWKLLHAGALRWEHWLPDNLHPESCGSRVYADAVGALVRDALDPAFPATPALPLRTPRDAACWERTAHVPLEDVQWAGPWVLRRHGTSGWIDRVLHTTAPGASLRAEFEGRGLAVCCDYGDLSGEFRWRIDGGPWTQTQRLRAAWIGDAGWFHTTVCTDSLEPGRHVLELENVQVETPGCRGATCSIALLGILR